MSLEQSASEMNPKLKMLVGLPCSGKSTWAQRNIGSQFGGMYNVVSSDKFLEKWAQETDNTYQETFELCASFAQDEMYKDVGRFVADSVDIIWDQTNLTRKSRLKKLKMFMI